MNSDVIYDTLLNIIKNDVIKEQYFELLGQLTDAPIMTNDEFINKVNEISKMGTIIVCYYIVCNHVQIIGTGTIIVEPKLIHGGKSVGHIEDIVVHKDHRKKGIATNIVNKLVDLYHDCYKIILDCKDELVDFYKLAGFKKYGNQMAIYN